jgi:hypothetical protein
MCRESTRAFEWSGVDIGTHKERAIKLILDTTFPPHPAAQTQSRFKNSQPKHGAIALILQIICADVQDPGLFEGRCFVMRNIKQTLLQQDSLFTCIFG